MDRQEYTAAVLAQLRRVTRAERRDISRELNAHMEDHACALLDLGYSEEEAERRVVESMGDPVETGRELNRQYRHYWLVVVRWAARAVLFFACALLLLNRFMIGDIFGAVTARFDSGVSDYAWAFAHEEIRVQATETINERLPVGDDILRIVGVSIADDISGRYAGKRVAIVQYRCFDRIPGGYVSQALASKLLFYDERGELAHRTFVKSGLRAVWGGCVIPVESTDTTVTLRGDYMGCHIERVIELPEVGQDG